MGTVNGTFEKHLSSTQKINLPNYWVYVWGEFIMQR
jgi:hypothetical protein